MQEVPAIARHKRSLVRAMEEKHPQLYSSQQYQASRKQVQSQYHSYEGDLEDDPLEEEPKVVPLPGTRSLDSLAEEPLTPRPSKRKSSSQSKAKSTTSKKKSSNSLRSVPSAGHQPFADELRRLEAQADKINQILAERTRKKDWQQSQPMPGMPAQPLPPGYPEHYQQPYHSPYPGVPQGGYEGYASPSLEQEETENLKLHAQRIKHRLAQLEQQMEAASYPPPPAQPLPVPPSPHPATAPASPSWNPPSWEQQRDHRQQQQAEQDAWDTATELRYLNQHLAANSASGAEEIAGMAAQGRSYSRSKTSRTDGALRSLTVFVRRLAGWRALEVPRKHADRLGDAAMWVAAGAISQAIFRFSLTLVPSLAPVFTLLTLMPAMLAVFLVFFAPKTGWVPYYRLFLLTLGLLIGSKFL